MFIYSIVSIVHIPSGFLNVVDVSPMCSAVSDLRHSLQSVFQSVMSTRIFIVLDTVKLCV